MPTYYVDATGGNDNNTGLSEGQAWQSIAKVNGRTFVPGDRILFKRGQSWSDQLTIASSGISSNWIVYGAYGTGARPIINGNTGAAWDMAAIFVPSPYHHVRIEHFDCNGSNAANYSAMMIQSHDIYVYDCIARNAQNNGIAAWKEDGANIYNIVLDGCEVYDNYGSGIEVTSNTGLYGPHDCEVKNCIAHDNGNILWYQHGIYIRHGVTVHDCVCYNNSVGAGIKLNSMFISQPYTPVAYNNTCYNNKSGLIAYHYGQVIYNNLIYNNEFNVEFDKDSHNMTFVFNTLINSTGPWDATNFRIAGDGGIYNNVIKNNLIIQDAAVADKFIARGFYSTDIDSLAQYCAMDYNVYYTNGVAGDDRWYDTNTSINWTEWRAMTGSPDAHSTFLTALPDFVSRYTDLHPSAGGNLVGRGIWMSQYTIDKDGNTRANPPTPGCFESSQSAQRSSKHAYTLAVTPNDDVFPAFLRGATGTTGSKPAYMFAGIVASSDRPGYLSGVRNAGGIPTSGYKVAYLAGVNRNRLAAYLQGIDDIGGSMATSFIWLKTSDAGVTKSKKFRVIAEGYDDGTPDKTVSMEKTIGGGLDISQGAIYKSWSPIVKIRHTEPDPDYGTLADLEYFYSLNDPGATPSNVVTFVDHHDQSYTVMLIGEFRKQLLSAVIEGQYAWYLVRLKMVRMQ